MPEPIDIAEGRHLLDTATPGQWELAGDRNQWGEERVVASAGEMAKPLFSSRRAEAQLIVWARNNLPTLLDQYEGGRRELSLNLWRRLGNACDEVPPPNYAEDDYNAGIIEGLSRAQRIIRAALDGDQ